MPSTSTGDVLVFANGILTPLEGRGPLAPAHSRAARRRARTQGLAAGISPGGRHGAAAVELVPAIPGGRSAGRHDAGRRGCVCEHAARALCGGRECAELGRAEDYAVGPSLRVGLLGAPSAFGYEEGGAGVQLNASAGVVFPMGFAQLSGAANGLITGSGVDSGSVVFKGYLVIQPSRMNAIIAGGFIGWQKNPVPGSQFDLGLVYGPRAYPLHAFTGDRGFLVAAEYRWTFVENLGGLLGMALGTFVDYGGAWYAGESPRTGTDFGAGLRFGPQPLASPVLFRLDVAYRVEAAPFTAGWSIVFGEGFTF